MKENNFEVSKEVEFILNVLFFGLSLQTYYFYQYDLPLFSIFSYVLLLFFAFFLLNYFPQLKIPIRPLIVPICYLLLAFWSLLGLAVQNEFPQVKRCLAFIVTIAGGFIAVIIMKIVPIVGLLKSYLIVHLSFFWTQFLLFYLFGITIDFLYPFTGEEQRMFGGTFTFPIINRSMRAAGLFNEPGTYATFTAPVVALFERWKEESKINSALFWLGLLSLFLSFSFYGILFGVIILILSNLLNKRIKLLFTACLFPIIGPVLYFRFVYRRSLGQDTGLEIRKTYLSRSFDFINSSLDSFSFGANLLANDPRIELGMAHNDIGLLGYLLHFSGVPVAIVLIGLFTYTLIKLDRPGRIACIIFLISKHSIFAPFFPFLAVAAFFPAPKGNSKKNFF